MNTTPTGRSEPGQKDTKAEARQEVEKAADSIRQDAEAVGKDLKKVGEQQAQQGYAKGQQEVTRQAETLAGAIDSAADHLDQEDHPLGVYARDAAQQLSSFADSVSNKSLEELASDTRRLARENPAMFLLGSVALGVAGGRFFSASDRRGQDDYVDGRNASRDARDTQGSIDRTDRHQIDQRSTSTVSVTSSDGTVSTTDRSGPAATPRSITTEEV